MVIIYIFRGENKINVMLIHLSYLPYLYLAGKMVHSMVAHLEAVTSLAVDPNGLYLLSGSKSCHNEIAGGGVGLVVGAYMTVKYLQ